MWTKLVRTSTCINYFYTHIFVFFNHLLSSGWLLNNSEDIVYSFGCDKCLPRVSVLPGFSLQSYFGLQKSSTMDGTNTQVNLKVEDPVNFMPPKIEISGIESQRVPTRPHKLKPRDMNVLTPSGF